MKHLTLIFMVMIGMAPRLMGLEKIPMPALAGEPWTVAGNPDLGKYTSPKQQVVDFAVWQAADGTWQLWACVRATNCGGKTRLFHRWEGKRLTDTDWTPKGIAMEADPALGETAGGLQAPHVVRPGEREFVMAYGDWEHICFATSRDGRQFERRIGPGGKTAAFGEGPECNTRDAMLLFSRGKWFCYYTAYPQRLGADYARTSPDLKNWSESVKVAFGGEAGTNAFSAECPHVVEPRPGKYYLFRTQRYGPKAQTTVYCSSDPLNFGINEDAKRIGVMAVAAPEIVKHEGQYYMAYLRPDLHGIQVARMKWGE